MKAEDSTAFPEQGRIVGIAWFTPSLPPVLEWLLQEANVPWACSKTCIFSLCYRTMWSYMYYAFFCCCFLNSKYTSNRNTVSFWIVPWGNWGVKLPTKKTQNWTVGRLVVGDQVTQSYLCLEPGVQWFSMVNILSNVQAAHLESKAEMMDHRIPILCFRWGTWMRRGCLQWNRSQECCWPNWERLQKVLWRNQWPTVWFQ